MIKIVSENDFRNLYISVEAYALYGFMDNIFYCFTTLGLYIYLLVFSVVIFMKIVANFSWFIPDQNH